jgi:hypothetical protein
VTACHDDLVRVSPFGTVAIRRWSCGRGLAAVAATLAGVAAGCGGPASSTTPVAPSPACLASGDETTINAALAGPSGTAVLCRGAVFELHGPVVFTRDGQQLYTEGFPTGVGRATLRVVDPSVATALVLTNRNGVRVAHVIVDGNRPALGRMPAGNGLIEAGGDASGQQIEYVLAFEPRGWTCLHAAEGLGLTCSGMTIAHNSFGPAGQPNGEWADGLSLACRSSMAFDNTITDATDAGLVVFGAPGSVVSGNTIRAVTRPLLGGITMVDIPPFGGDFTGTVVDSNVIDGAGQKIRIGLAMGWQTWTCQPNAPRLSGAVVSRNLLQGEMGYGYAIDGVTDWTVTDNVSTAHHVGIPLVPCAGRLQSLPQPFLVARDHSSGTFQSDFKDAVLDGALFAFGAPGTQSHGRVR